jgi:large subunit ribosomal protein L9
MEVILMEKLGNLGDLGEVVKVKGGYARNYLIPQGMAKRATPANLEEFARKKVELERVAAEKLVAAQERAAKIEGYVLQITKKAGVDGRLFGSVTNSDIAEAMQAQGLEVSKFEVRMPEGTLKMIGDYPVNLVLHTDVTVEIKVSVLGES